MALRTHKSTVSYSHQLGPRLPPYTKYLRQNFHIDDAKRDLAPIRDVVSTRTERIYLVKPVADKFFKNYRRRQENMVRGHFSLEHHPYKIMGDTLLLDPRAIIIHVFKDKLERTHLRKLRDIFDICNEASQDDKKSLSEDNVAMEPLAPLSNTFPRTVLWSFLKEGEKLMWLTKSNGQHFYEELVNMLLEEKYTEVVLDELKNPMVLRTLSSLLNVPPESPASSRPSSAYGEVMDDLSADASQQSIAQTTEAVSASFSTNSLAHKKNRRKNEHLKMLQYLHKILDMLCNLPTKLLRSKVPLNREALNGLLTANKPCSYKTHTSHGGRGLSIDTKAGASSSMMPKPQHLGKATPSSVGAMHRAGSPRYRMSSPRTITIETWDDLIALHDRQQKGKQLYAHIDNGSPINSPNCLAARSSHQLLDERQSTIQFASAKTDVPRKNQATLPPSSKQILWQTLMNDKLTPVESSSDEKRWSERMSKTGKGSAENDPAMRLRKLAKNFRTCGEVMDKEYLYMLQKLDRKKMSSFRFKFATLSNLRTLDFYEKHRLYVKQLDLGADPADQAETEQSTWMMKLIRDTNRVSRKDTQLSNMMQKLAKFSYVDTTTPTYGRAKLCLLIMSLPANELCEIYAQKALKFVVEEVLLSSKGVFKRWMEQRQIPSVIESAEHSPLP